MDNFEDIERGTVDAAGTAEPQHVYETPELIELGQAKSLMQGLVYTKPYQDCGDNGTTDYRPSC